MDNASENKEEENPEGDNTGEWQDPGHHVMEGESSSGEDSAQTGTETSEGSGEEDGPPFIYYLFQAFLVPALMVGAVLIMFLGIRWLFSSGRSVNELMATIEGGAQRERWVAATELARRIGRNRESLKKFRNDRRMKVSCLRIFKEAHPDEEKLMAYMARILGMLKYKPAVPVLEQKLNKTGSTRVRMSILQGLGDIGAEESVKAVESYTQHLDPGVRQSAVYALGQMQSEKGIPLLTEALSDSVPHVRLNAALGLASYPEEKEIPRKRVVEILSHMLDREYVEQLRQPDGKGNMKKLKLQDVNRMMMGALQGVRALKQKDLVGKIRTITESDKSSRALRREARKTISELTSNND